MKKLYSIYTSKQQICSAGRRGQIMANIDQQQIKRTDVEHRHLGVWIISCHTSFEKVVLIFFLGLHRHKILFPSVF